MESIRAKGRSSSARKEQRELKGVWERTSERQQEIWPWWYVETTGRVARTQNEWFRDTVYLQGGDDEFSCIQAQSSRPTSNASSLSCDVRVSELPDVGWWSDWWIKEWWVKEWWVRFAPIMEPLLLAIRMCCESCLLTSCTQSDSYHYSRSSHASMGRRTESGPVTKGSQVVRIEEVRSIMDERTLEANNKQGGGSETVFSLSLLQELGQLKKETSIELGCTV